MLALLAGASILGASVYAADTTQEVDTSTQQYMDTRKLGIWDNTMRAQQAISGADLPFTPFPAPRQQGINTVTDAQRSYADDVTNTMFQQAAFQMRPRGKQRLPQANSGNAPYLIKVLGNGTMGGIRGAETLNNNPMTTRGNIDFIPGRDLIKNSPNTGNSTFNAATMWWNPQFDRISMGGVSFSRRINPFARGGDKVTIQQQLANSARGKQLPVKGKLTPIPTEERNGLAIVM